MAEYYSIVCIHHSFFIHSSVDGHLGCFHVLAIVNSHGHDKMVNTKIRLIIFFTAKDGKALYSQQKQDQELTVAQTMNSLLPNSD